jgi:arylsulfatase A-like enzyme
MGIRENTLELFHSDNVMNMVHHGITGKGQRHVPMNMYDTSVWCRRTFRTRSGAQGVERRTLEHYDFMPTLLDYFGLDIPRRRCRVELCASLRGANAGGRETPAATSASSLRRICRPYDPRPALEICPPLSYGPTIV